MASIEIKQLNHNGGYAFQVTIREGGGATHHEVTLRGADYERFTGGKASPEALVSESFRFLLEREPKEAILDTFDLSVIGRYFPEYRREIAQRL